MPDSDVHVDGDDVTGVVVEEALDVVWRAVEPDHDRLLALVHAAQERATELGVTGVHDMVRGSAAPAVYRELDRVGELSLRVRLNYWADHLDALDELGLRTNHGSGMVRTGAVKTYIDGSIGARTAKLWAPYADAAEQSGDTGETPTDATSANRGQWVVAPDELQDIAAQAETGDRQLAAHAIGDEAIAATLDVLAEATGQRHRVEHAEVLTDDLVERLGEGDVVVSAQPNFLKWARTGGLYDRRLGVERSRSTNRFRDLLDAGAQLAFGSDCMPLGPLFGVEQAVTAPADGQRLSPTEALRAYTWGGAYAGFDEDRLGTAEPGKRADLVVLEASPWAVDPDDIGAIDVALTLVDGQVVHDGR
jgi:predicted amidohydrolase YtcJ